MKRKPLIGLLMLAVAYTTALTSCINEKEVEGEPAAADLSLNFSVSTLSTNTSLAFNSDDTFESLALYIYDNDITSTLEQMILMPLFVPADLREWSRSFEVGPGVKNIYALVNYTATSLKTSNGTPLVLSPTTTQQELDNLIAESPAGFLSHRLLMVGKESVTVTLADNNKSVIVPVHRLQARVDVHVFKGPNMASSDVTIKSVTLKNQIRNSEVKFSYDVNTAQMLSVPLTFNQPLTSTAVLSPYVQGATLIPTGAQAVFYSFQNLVKTVSPLPLITPSLEIKVLANGVEYTYNSYLTDANQTDHLYSLLQNQVYQVTAVLDINSQLFLSINVLPWDKAVIDYNRPVTADDFAFAPWGSGWGGINGKTMNTNVGGLEDAAFSFELKTPAGANWCATLTNGLDFTFTNSTAGITNQAVTQGSARPGIPYLIAVRAAKHWTGQTRDTELYLTVEGVEIPINPLVAGVRRYEGTDTRIKIRQVASYN